MNDSYCPQVFYKYLIDADWSVSAGNWMWVSSSAFERRLDCSVCICPVEYGRRIEPTGDYIRYNFGGEFRVHAKSYEGLVMKVKGKDGVY